MAQRTIVHLVDDVSGDDADETVSFALDGQPYEIDLSSDNAARLRESLAEFVASARKAASAPATPAGLRVVVPPAPVTSVPGPATTASR